MPTRAEFDLNQTAEAQTGGSGRVLYQYLLVSPDTGNGRVSQPIVCAPHEVLSEARKVLAATGAAQIEIWQGLDHIGTVSGEPAGG